VCWRVDLIAHEFKARQFTLAGFCFMCIRQHSKGIA
jgi:hypothetical protein